MSLRQAGANIHNDPLWWRTVLINGALMISIVGYPLAAGLVIESLDNTRKGYPTPLPPWVDWTSRYIIGIFAFLIDFIYFLLPIAVAALLLLCAAVVTVVGQVEASAQSIISIVVIGLIGYQLAMFLLSVSPVGRLIYCAEGTAENAMSGKTLREAFRPGARLIFARARLRSLPAYLPALLFWWLTTLAARATFTGAWILALILLWLTCSALLYGHLLVAQVYAAAERELPEGEIGVTPIGMID